MNAIFCKYYRAKVNLQTSFYSFDFILPWGKEIELKDLLEVQKIGGDFKLFG